MIKTTKGIVEIKGTISEVLADVSIVIHSTKKFFTEKLGEETANDLITNAIEQGLMDEEEVEQKVKEKLETLGVDTLLEILKEALKHE